MDDARDQEEVGWEKGQECAQAGRVGGDRRVVESEARSTGLVQGLGGDGRDVALERHNQSQYRRARTICKVPDCIALRPRAYIPVHISALARER